jgi:hypothetical protein
MSDAEGQVEGGGPAAETLPLSADAVLWAFRLLLGRDPIGNEVEAHRVLPSLDYIRTAFANHAEFREFFDAALDGKVAYQMPLFLLRRPAAPALPWRFEPPSIDAPVSQFCTSAQFDEPAFAEIAEAFATPLVRTRRLWQQCFIVSVLATAGLIGPGRRALGFGVGRERIPALLASRGVEVTATDLLPPGAPLERHLTTRRSHLFFPEILHLEDFEQLVEFRPLDMNALPADLEGGFDCCWSASAVDRLGSIARATAFIEASLAPLRPGGVAVHTMAFNLSSNSVTAEGEELSVLRRCDIEALAEALVAAGHSVDALNFHPGADAEDEAITAAPDGPPRTKQRLNALVIGIFGLVVRKGG